MLESNIIHLYAAGYDSIIPNLFDAAIEVGDKKSGIIPVGASEVSAKYSRKMYNLNSSEDRYPRCSMTCKLHSFYREMNSTGWAGDGS